MARPNPILPGTPQDRTGSGGIVRRAHAEIRKRWGSLRKDVLAIFDRIPRLRINEADFGRVSYMLTPEQMQIVDAELQAALERWIVSGRDPANFHWFAPYEADSAFLGTSQSVANLGRLSSAYSAARSLADIVRSEPYRTRAAMAQFRSYEHWTGLSAELKSELTSVITRAVVDGKNPRAVRREIAERLDVSMSKAAQYAQTDITGTLREARVAEAQQAEDELGIKTGLLWTSALKPTTRPWHASRHGRAYSRGEVKAFYGERGNKYNCYCSITECLLDDKGKPILSDTAKRAMLGELKAWKSATGK